MSVRYRRNPAATERRVNTSLFLANPLYGTLYRVNETVAALWTLLAEPASLEEATALFRQAFPDVPASDLAHDVAVMFADLVEEELIVPVDVSA